MKKVFKFATGAVIPDGAQYLNTKVEKFIVKERHIDFRGDLTDSWDITEKNRFVWHYFLVEVKDETS